jgi:phosphatidylglycerophosphate synthase
MTKAEEIKYKDFLKIPNIVTVGRIFVAFMVLILTCLNYKIYLIKWLFVGGILSDKLDGFLARKLNQKTKLGLILEQLADTFLVFFTVLFIYYRLDFPKIAFYSYLGIIFIGLIVLVIVYILRKELFALKLIVAEITITFIYTAGLLYLFSIPYRLYFAYFTLFLGVISLIDYLFRLFKFNRNLKNNEGGIK